MALARGAAITGVDLPKFELVIETFAGEQLREPVIAADWEEARTIASMRLMMTPGYRRVDTLEDGRLVSTISRDIERRE